VNQQGKSGKRGGRNAKTQVLKGGGCVKRRDNVVNLKKMSTKPNFVWNEVERNVPILLRTEVVHGKAVL
jgi:hypothetical protein